jgi:hypothetical protein
MPPAETLRQRAEALWEELGGDLCVCQRPEVPHWCETCQRRIDTIGAAFQRWADQLQQVVTALEQPDTLLKAETDVARGIVETAHQLIRALIDVRWQDGEQVLICLVCLNRRGAQLHRDSCPVYALHAALDEHARPAASEEKEHRDAD